MTRVLFLLGVTATAGKILVRDKRIPRPVRWVLMLTVVCLWIPGPVDEVVILLTFGLVVVFWRQPLREAWAQARTDREKARERRSLGPSRRERVWGWLRVVPLRFVRREAPVASDGSR